MIFDRIPNLLMLVAMCFFSLAAEAQSITGVEERGIVLKNIRSYGLFIHSGGFGMHYRQGRMKTGFRSSQWELGLLNMKHPKEIRSVNPFSDNAGGYVYGKLNTLFILRGGYGIHKVLHPEGDQGGVETGLHLFGGASLGILKPMYLTIFYYDDQYGIQERTERYNPALHFPDNISGRAPFGTGIGKSTLHPGMYATAALTFELGREQKHIRMLETGLSADIFAAPLEMMAYNPKRQFFVTLFIKASLGKMWN